MKGRTIAHLGRYTLDMETVILVVLAVVVALVAIDAIARLDERTARRREAAGKTPRRDDGTITTQKIVIDLSRRG